jgi:hypothetical protein
LFEVQYCLPASEPEHADDRSHGFALLLYSLFEVQYCMPAFVVKDADDKINGFALPFV